jgi:hypothetical protein
MNWILVYQPDGHFAMFQPKSNDLSSYMMKREEAFWWLNRKGLSLKEAEDLVYNLENDRTEYVDEKGNPVSSWNYALNLIEKEHGKEHVKNLIHEMTYFYGFNQKTPWQTIVKIAKTSLKTIKFALLPVSALFKGIFFIGRKLKQRRDNKLWNRGISKHVDSR